MLSEPTTHTPVCNLTNECVLFIGNDFTNITGTPHVFSQGFYVNPTPGDTGANPGDGSAPSVATAPSAALSTVVANRSTAVADGVDAVTVTVTLLGTNSQSQTVPIPGATVSLSAGSGHSTITPASAGSDVTNGSGVATFTVTDATAEAATYTATSGGVTVTEAAQVTFAAPAVSASSSVVAASPASVPADGTTPSTLTVTVRDQAASHSPLQGETVTLSQGAGAHSTITTVSGVTNASGVATFTVTDTSSELVTYTAAAGGVTISETAAVTFGTLSVSASASTVSPASKTAATGANGGTAVTVTLLTAGGTSPVAGKSVTLTASAGAHAVVSPSSGEQTDAAGKATFTVTDLTAETVTFSAVDTTDTLTLTNTATVTFQVAGPPAPSPTLSTVTVSPKSVLADGTHAATIGVTVLNTLGAAVPGKKVSVVTTPNNYSVTVIPITTQSGVLEGTTDSSGSADFIVRSTDATLVTFVITDTTDHVQLTPPAPIQVTFTPGVVDGNQSTLIASPSAVAANGSAESIVSVTFNDHFGNAVPGKHVMLTQAGGQSAIAPLSAVTNAHGMASFHVTDTRSEYVTYSAVDVDDDLIVTQTATVTFGTPPPIPPAPADCAIVSNYSVVPADGRTAATISVFLYSADGEALSGRKVSVGASHGSAVVTPLSPTSNAAGVATFSVTDTVDEVVTFTAVDTSDNVPVDGNVMITFGSAGAAQKPPVVGMATTPDGKGYWLVADDGGIFSYGDAHLYGSASALPLNNPIVGMASTPDGKGYWLVASDGGIFGFGDAGFHGSTGAMLLNRPIVGMASTPDGKGYWLVASDGGIFSFGDAGFHGSTGAMHPQPADRGHGVHARRQGLLAGRLRRRHLLLRGRRLPRVDGCHGPQPADRRVWRPRPTARATGWSPPTAASSPSVTPASTGRPARCRWPARSWAWRRLPAGPATGWSPPTAGSSPEMSASTDRTHR